MRSRVRTLYSQGKENRVCRRHEGVPCVPCFIFQKVNWSVSNRSVPALTVFPVWMTGMSSAASSTSSSTDFSGRSFRPLQSVPSTPLPFSHRNDSQTDPHTKNSFRSYLPPKRKKAIRLRIALLSINTKRKAPRFRDALHANAIQNGSRFQAKMCPNTNTRNSQASKSKNNPDTHCLASQTVKI